MALSVCVPYDSHNREVYSPRLLVVLSRGDPVVGGRNKMYLDISQLQVS
jgi:hypothetical protein